MRSRWTSKSYTNKKHKQSTNTKRNSLNLKYTQPLTERGWKIYFNTKAAWSQERLSLIGRSIRVSLLLPLWQINVYHMISTRVFIPWKLISDNNSMYILSFIPARTFPRYLQIQLHFPRQARANDQNSDQIQCTQVAHWKNLKPFLYTCHRILHQEGVTKLDEHDK